ncbi:MULTISPECIES: membrane protein insertase YidC [Sphingomonas]|uniref:membrane protein insertase YidC n=1 Tax=Sphingomonas TaxID=13687 RepID=UPI000F7EEB11|nr:membrane protein insertase YidC [Sphingomonas sp. ABOLF]RSV14654.1 membrane protein insertase YidC [Sphingomonas sp. ABOLF]GLK19261.1 membrane protein insertase YidC [Microbacterium terregens]
MKNDQKNFVLFAVLAAVILFGWQPIASYFFPAANPPATKIVEGKSEVVPNPGADPAADSPTAVRDRALVLRETPRIAIETPRLKGSINLKGARIDDLVLTRHKETIAKNSDPIRILSPSGTGDAYFASFGWSGNGVQAPGADTVWQASGTRLTPATPVTLTTQVGGQRYAIQIAVDDGYMFTVRQTIGNAGTQPVQAATYGLLSRRAPPRDKDTWSIHSGPIYEIKGGVNFDVNYTDVDEAPQKFDTQGGWAGFTDHYWLTALVPDQGKSNVIQFRNTGDNVHQADYRPATLSTVQPGQQVTATSRFFAGAKEVDLLDRYEDAGVVQFGNAIDWGWFGIVEKPIFAYLDWLFRMIGNFGVAIILLTLTIRLLMFPIAQRQFASMAAMRALQPKLKTLQERYKDDKPRLQQEMMALYKQEKVNPVAGCLPTLLQIPVFYALYKVLMLTIEMRHQPFVGWIKDLSAPDPLTPVNLFGLLPFTPPSFIAIGVIPILLGVSMYFQFKLNPQPMDDAQKQVFGLMPWVMMFIMAPFAVGLQVYWITSNLLTIAQQQLLYSRHPGLKTAPAK